MDNKSFTYTFDFFGFYYELIDDDFFDLIRGYIYLHQLVVQDLFELSNENLVEIFEKNLEDDEYITINNDQFILHLNYVDDEVIEYVKLILKYSLTLYTDFEVRDKMILFKRYYEN